MCSSQQEKKKGATFVSYIYKYIALSVVAIYVQFLVCFCVCDTFGRTRSTVPQKPTISKRIPAGHRSPALIRSSSKYKRRETAEKARAKLQFFWWPSKLPTNKAQSSLLSMVKFMLSGSQNSNNKRWAPSTGRSWPPCRFSYFFIFFFPLCEKSRKEETYKAQFTREEIGLYRDDHIRNSNYKNKLVVYLYSCCLDPFSGA